MSIPEHCMQHPMVVGVGAGTGLLHGIPVALGVMDFTYMGGSMGSVVGEKLTRLIEYATQEGLTLMIVSTSGGARMQEGIMSLMQARDAHTRFGFHVCLPCLFGDVVRCLMCAVCVSLHLLR